MKESAICPAQ